MSEDSIAEDWMAKEITLEAGIYYFQYLIIKENPKNLELEAEYFLDFHGLNQQGFIEVK